MSDPTLTINDLNALPEKMRAHAAAKAVGMTSKEFLAAMSAIGVEIKSAQSGVTRDVLLDWFNRRGGGGTDAGAAAEDAAPAVSAEDTGPAERPARKAPAKKAPAKKAAAEKAPAKKAAAEKAAAPPAEKESAGTEPAEKSSGGKAPARSKGGAASPAAETPGRAPLPEAIVTGEVGADEQPGRRRRSTATPTYSPLFLSPEEAAAGDAHPGPTGAAGPAHSTDSASSAPSGSDDGSGDRSGSGSDDDSDNGDSGNGSEGGSRRRRRGRRGRGRGRGENTDDQNNAGDQGGSGGGNGGDGQQSGGSTGPTGDDESSGSGTADGGASTGADAGGKTDSDDSGSRDGSDSSDSSGDTPSGSRRRRRRRRRGGGGGSNNGDQQNSGDDPADTEIHERDPRRRSGRGGQGSGTSTDEVRGITGSTRLEAKRQRRRDGREAGRRRQPILSESEFLARRESVDRVMVVREKNRDDGKGVMTQVGVLEDKVLVEHFVTTESARSMVGNVFLGRVQNVLPSMEAAFVDIGRGRNGVLYAGEVNWEAAGLGGKARRIEQALKPGDMVLVQVTKDPIGQKGARLSTQISLAGRFLVYVPDGNSTGISRKLPDTERRRLKAILKDVVPEGSGVIIRTAAEGVSEEEIGRDVERLSSQWAEIAAASEKRTASGSGNPVALYEEPDLLVKVVRDLFNEDFSKLVIEGDASWDTVHDYVSRVAPEMVDRLERHENTEVDVFAAHRVDEQLAKALDRKVWLPSGGSLVIDRTEAMTVVDVNTGKYTGSGGNLEETVTKNNLEAAEEIVRQLRLRDIGGMVIVDFIDMVLESNRDLVLRRLTETLGRDRTRHQVSEVTSLGLVQLTRKKLGTGLVEAFSTPCEHCQGRGLLVHADPVHTESHNADEAGGRRGRRRGGKGPNGSGQNDGPKQTPKKDGPAPSAHPAALAMGRGDGPARDGQSDSATDGQQSSEQPPKDAPADNKPKKDAPADDKSTKDSPAAGRSKQDRQGTEKAQDDAADAADAVVVTSPDAGAAAPGAAAEKSGETGTRSRRRRVARRDTTEPVTPSNEDVSAGRGDSAPAVDESTVVAEAESAVAEVEESAPASGTAATDPAPSSTAPATATPTAAGTSAGRPRRRSTRRAAGAAAQTPPTAPEPAPAEELPVEAATLAEAPTAVVAEPRKRPVRRRATRSTVAPETDSD